MFDSCQTVANRGVMEFTHAMFPPPLPGLSGDRKDAEVRR